MLLAHLVASNDRLNRYKVVSLAVSLAGLLLIVGTGSDGSPLDWRGIGGIVLLLACILLGCGSLTLLYLWGTRRKNS